MGAVQDYTQHWDEKFRTRDWGRWPPEDLVRFMGRNYKHVDRGGIRVLEVGCGPGANVWFLYREGYGVAGIDGSPAAIDIAARRLAQEGTVINTQAADLRVGNFSVLPWPDASFDVVVDVFSVCSNPVDVIEKTLTEIRRVLKPGGQFYSKQWGRNTTGYGQGAALEANTYDDIPYGPCCGMGLTHFFDLKEIEALFGRYFTVKAIETVTRKEVATGQIIEEHHCQFIKAT